MKRPETKANRASRRQGFTLIEMLGVIAIILILSTITLAGVRYAQQKAKRSKTEATIEDFSAVVEEYFAAKGYYPSSLSDANLPTPSYDAWGNQINYWVGHKISGVYTIRQEYAIYSYGPDGSKGDPTSMTATNTGDGDDIITGNAYWVTRKRFN